MDDLLLFHSIKRVSYGQIGRSIGSIIEKWIKDFSKRNTNYLEQIYNIWVIEISIQNKRIWNADHWEVG